MQHRAAGLGHTPASSLPGRTGGGGVAARPGGDLLEAYRSLVDGTFTETEPYGPGQRVTLAAAPDVGLTLDHLLR